MSGDLTIAIVAFLVSVAVLIGVGLFVITMVLRAQRKHRKRLARVGRKRISGRLDIEDARLSLVRQKDGAGPIEAVSDALARFVPLLDTVTLRARISRAGMKLSVGSFILISLLVGAMLAAAGSFLLGLSPILLALPGLYGGMLLVDGVVKLRGETLANRFMRQLPEAIDTIIRGIRSGLPVIECIGNVGQEYGAPIGDYFRTASERIRLGEPTDAALWRVAKVVRRPEMDFLAVSISIQMETGGSLADALGNLADLLRKREQMKLKIRAISSEARASALIIGALPFVMMGLLATMSPDYIAPLFTDPRGHVMLGMGLASIGIGSFVMWRMTKFEI